MRGFSIRDHVSSVLVATLSSAFGVALLQATGALAAIISGDSVTGSSRTVAALLTVVAIVFMVVALYVAAIVTANTFATIIAGRTRTIALLRLIGSSAAAQRRAVAREGLTVGILGAVVGAALGTAVTAGAFGLAVMVGAVPAHQYSYAAPIVLLPVLAVVLTTWLASWVGSRRVLVVSPMEATGAAVEQSREEVAARPRRNTIAVILFVLGNAILALGILIGLLSPVGVLVGLVGGILSFTGLVLGAHLIMPPALRLVGRLLGSSASARMAAENAVRYPERSSRTTIGLVIGITLITMFAVALESFQLLLRMAQQENPGYYAGIDEMVIVTVVVLTVLVGFSALIAALGMINNLALSVLQRRRELGLLRALGFTARQVRQLILAESAQLTLASVLVGLVLGTFYGWAGAQSLLGSIHGSPGVVLPAVPIALLVIIAAAAALLTVVASIAPSRAATRVTPVAALALD